jgi:hypothetical protein
MDVKSQGTYGSREPEKRWNDELAKIHSGLYVAWWECEYGGRWAIRHKDPRNGLDRLVMFVNGPHDEFREMGDDIIIGVRETIDWQKVDEYPDPKELFDAVQKEFDDYKRRERMREMGLVMDYNREHRKEWRKAMLDAMRDPRVARSLNKAALDKWHKRKIIV